MDRRHILWVAALLTAGVAVGCSNDPPPIQEAKKVGGGETKSDADFASKAPDQSDPAAVAIVTAAVNAHTGNDPAKLNALKKVAFTRTGRGTAGGPELVDEKWRFHIAWPDRIRHETELPGGRIITLALNGDSAWGHASGGQKTPLTPAQVRDFKIDGSAEWLWMLFPLIEPGTKVAPTPGVAVRGKPTDGVSVWREGMAEAKLYFDRETKYLVRMIFNGRENEQPVPKQVTMDGVRDYHGIKLPEQMVLEVNGKVWAEWSMPSIDLLPSIDAKVFENP